MKQKLLLKKKINFIAKLQTDRKDRAIKMVQMLKCLQCKREDLSLSPKNTRREPVTVPPAIPALERSQQSPWVALAE